MILRPPPAQLQGLFPGQAPNEEILIFVRRHWMPFVSWLIFIAIMLVIPVITGVLLVVTGGSWLFEQQRLVYVALGLGAYLLLVNAIFFTAWVEQYLDVAIITTNRFVHIRQIGLFNRRVAELGMERVQDVSAQMNGYLQSIFQFGTVVVETAGGAPDFVIRNVSKPHVVANTILMIHDQTRKPSVAASPESQNTVEVLDQTSMQQTLIEHVPSVAPPPGFKQEQLKEDLFTQALEARDIVEAIEEESATDVPPKPKPVAPNRLPPAKRTVADEYEGDLVEGEVISIDQV